MPNEVPFEILEVLGEGAFGAVCVARLNADPLRRQVAIKILKQEYASNPKVLQRTRDEARLLSRLFHPNIVRVEQLVEFQGRPVLVMELVRGLDLKTLVKRFPQGMPASVAMEVMRLTCVALDASYNESIGDDGQPLRVIHRDIKPSNMLLSVHGQLKVVDFGIATGQFSGREAKTDSVVMGSRPYMAPERLDRSPDTPAVDIYSAGMSLYELLAGNIMALSVNSATHDRSMSRHVDPLSPEGLSREAAEDLRRLIRRMCAYDVDFRPSARDAAAELQRLVDSIDPAHRVSLEEFARSVVEPLYAERRRVPLKVAIGRLQDKDFFTGPMDRAVDLPPPTPRSPEMHKQPAIFLGALFGLLVAFGSIAANKAFNQQMHQQTSAAAIDTARVRFWFPSEARARVGILSLAVPGSLDLAPGRQELDLSFEDGHTITCPFEAKDGEVVRYVMERGEGAISIDDRPVEPCNYTGMAEAQGPK